MDDKVSRKKGKGRKAQAPEEDEDPFGGERVPCAVTPRTLTPHLIPGQCNAGG
jgi:hypothetical protein